MSGEDQCLLLIECTLLGKLLTVEIVTSRTWSKTRGLQKRFHAWRWSRLCRGLNEEIVYEGDCLSRDTHLALVNFVVVAGVRYRARERRSWRNDDSQLLDGERGFEMEAAFQAGADVRPISTSEAAGLLILGVFFFERLRLSMS